MTTGTLPAAILDEPDGQQPESPGDVTIVLVTAPTDGVLHVLPPTRFRGGAEWVDPDRPIAVIDLGHSHVPVTPPVPGRLKGMLALNREPVSEHQAIAWMEPA